MEALIEQIAALGRLDESEARAGGLHPLPVDIALPFRDINALDGQTLGLGHAGMRV